MLARSEADADIPHAGGVQPLDRAPEREFGTYKTVKATFWP